jgi:acryloyl-coenzyme A reductase
VVFVGNVHPGNVAVNPAVSILKEIEFIGSAHATVADLVQIVGLVERGRLTPLIATTLPVDRAEQAHRMLDQRAATGRVVLMHG